MKQQMKPVLTKWDEDHKQAIQEYANKNHNGNFSEAVRVLTKTPNHVKLNKE